MFRKEQLLKDPRYAALEYFENETVDVLKPWADYIVWTREGTNESWTRHEGLEAALDYAIEAIEPFCGMQESSIAVLIHDTNPAMVRDPYPDVMISSKVDSEDSILEIC